jgi:hypothetical protein
MMINSINLFLFGVFLLSYLLTQFAFIPTIFSKCKNRWLPDLVGGLCIAVSIYLLLGNWNLLVLPLGAFLVFWGLETIRHRSGRESFHHSVLWLVIWLIIFLAFAYLLPIKVTIPSMWLVQFGVGYTKVLLILAGFFFVTFQVSQTVGLMLIPFQEEIRKTSKEILSSNGLNEGGKWIGILERALVFVFVLSNQYAAIGFLVAAKSILRFGEVKDNSNRMEAEYIIIGTLSSILFALLVGMGTSSLVTLVK